MAIEKVRFVIIPLVLVCVAVGGLAFLFPPARPLGDFEHDKFVAVGSKQAKLQLTVVSDYRCRHCQEFEYNILPMLKKKYADTGKLRIHFAGRQFLSNESYKIAALLKVVEQTHPQHFAKAKHIVFEKTLFESDPMKSIEALVAQGIVDNNVEDLIKQTQQDVVVKAVESDNAYIGQFGINEVPSVILGHELVSNPESLESVERAIDAQLEVQP